MSWNYRVVVENKGTEDEYWSIREVYYNDDGEICGMTADGGTSAIGIDKGELTADFLNMLNALYSEEIVLDENFVFAPWNFDLKDCEDLGLTEEATEFYGKKEKE